MATSCCASTSRGLRGKRVDSMWPSCMARVTAAQATRSARYFGKENAFADRIHMVTRAADALHAAGDRGRRFNLDDQINGAHIDAEFERGGGAECANLPGLQLLFNHGALRGRKRTMMRAGDGLSGQFVQRAGQPLGHLAAVHEKDGGVALANDFKQARMNCVPDGDAARHLRGRAGGNFFHLAEARHVFNRNLDAELQLLARAGVHHRDRPIRRSRVERRRSIARVSALRSWLLLFRDWMDLMTSCSPDPACQFPLRRGSARLLQAGAAWLKGRCAAGGAWSAPQAARGREPDARRAWWAPAHEFRR